MLFIIKTNITDNSLLDQYYSELLWPLLQSNIGRTKKEEILELIKNAFAQNIGHFTSVIGLDQLINMIDYLESSSQFCCEKHHKILIHKTSPKSGTEFVPSDNKAVKYILQIIELYFQNGKINPAEESFKLCRLLSKKLSPCFILDLLNLIRRVLTQKMNEKISENQAKKIIKFFVERKVITLFLHVIETNFFAEIKAECVRIIYMFILRRSSDEEKL